MRIFLLAVLSAALSAQTIKVTGGIAESQVVQRDSNNKADIKVTGTASDADGKQIEARVLRGIVPVFGLTWKKYGTISGGKWEATLTNISTGGPYKLQVRIAGTKVETEVNPIFVGDLWVLAGQSNMEGVGNLEFVQAPDEKVRTIDMVEEKWQPASEPLHSLPGAVDQVHWQLNAEKQPEKLTGEKLAEFNKTRKKGAGLGLPFGVAYAKEAGVPVGLIPCAHGGTSMDQWDPEKYEAANAGSSLYGSMMRRVELASPGRRVMGVLWYQGEAETSPTKVPLFKDKFEKFVTRVRKDFANPGMPFYYVQIGRYVNHVNPDSWNQIQEIQRSVESRIANSAVFASVDSELDDVIHVGTQDLKRIGTNMGKFAAGKTKRGPRIAGVQIEDDHLRVKYIELNGKLTTKDRLNGFTIHDASGQLIPIIYKQEIDAKDPTSVLIYLVSKLPEGATLQYGAGKDPYCNLRDEQGFGALAFGPAPIK